MDATLTMWLAAIAVVVLFGALLWWVVRVLARPRMMRCPETGSITFVQTAPSPGAEASGPGVTVTQCDLWPQRKGCAQGCLDRYRETVPGVHVDLHSLRPFEPR